MVEQEFNTKVFAERLMELRNERGLATRELSKMLGFGEAMVSVWETEKSIPLASAIYKLAKFFGVSADYLLGLKDS